MRTLRITVALLASDGEPGEATEIDVPVNDEVPEEVAVYTMVSTITDALDQCGHEGVQVRLR